MLETGALPAMLRAELLSNDGTPIGYGFALLPPEYVARVVDQGGDNLTLKWKYCGGHGKAICMGARQSAIRVMCELSTFPELIPQSQADAQAAAPAPVVANSASTDATPDPERRLARLRELRGSATYRRNEWKFKGISALVAIEKNEGRKRSDEKTIRGDLKQAAQSELEARRAGFGAGLGQR